MSEYVNISTLGHGYKLLTSRQLWKIEGSGEDRSVTYLSTLAKHTQAVNVVRWCPKGMLLPYPPMLHTQSDN